MFYYYDTIITSVIRTGHGILSYFENGCVTVHGNPVDQVSSNRPGFFHKPEGRGVINDGCA